MGKLSDFVNNQMVNLILAPVQSDVALFVSNINLEEVKVHYTFNLYFYVDFD
jgi:hypothetical protein